jgi:hypothetical protein
LKSSQKPNSRTNKESGTIAETAAATALLKEGFGVSFAHGDCLGWDLVCDWEGKVSRLQVKTAKKINYTYHINLYHTHNSKKLYTKDDCDFIMAIVPYSDDYSELNEDGIYIVPVKEITKATIHLWPPGLGSAKTKLCQWEKYREAFNSLR